MELLMIGDERIRMMLMYTLAAKILLHFDVPLPAEL